MTVPSDSDYDPTVHLSLSDIALDDKSRPSQVQFTIKQSKTNPFRKGVGIFVGRTGTDNFPVAGLLNYLVVRGPVASPLFIFSDGLILTRQRFVDRVHDGLAEIEVDQSADRGHSFHIGVATTAAAKGIEDCVIKTVGK